MTIGGGQGGVGRNGGLQLLNATGVATIFLGDDGGTSNILVGGATNSTIQMGNAQGLTTIAMVGATGNMSLGARPRGSVPGQDGNLELLDGGGGSSIILTGNNGNVRCVSLTETSDLRLKKGIVPLLNALDKVLAMRGVRYHIKQQESRKEAFSEESQIGFIGQEVEGVCPEIVSTDPDGYKTVNYTRLTPILVEAMKEQQQFIQRQAVALREALEKIARIEIAMKEQSA